MFRQARWMTDRHKIIHPFGLGRLRGWLRGPWRMAIEQTAGRANPQCLLLATTISNRSSKAQSRIVQYLSVYIYKALGSRGIAEAQHVPSEIRPRKVSCRKQLYRTALNMTYISSIILDLIVLFECCPEMTYGTSRPDDINFGMFSRKALLSSGIASLLP